MEKKFFSVSYSVLYEEAEKENKEKVVVVAEDFSGAEKEGGSYTANYPGVITSEVLNVARLNIKEVIGKQSDVDQILYKAKVKTVCFDTEKQKEKVKNVSVLVWAENITDVVKQVNKAFAIGGNNRIISIVETQFENIV